MLISDAAEKTWESGVLKARGAYQIWDHENNQLVAACAIGAACYAIDPTKHIDNRDDAEKLIPELDDVIGTDMDDDPVRVADFIIDVNDGSNTEREYIIQRIRDIGY